MRKQKYNSATDKRLEKQRIRLLQMFQNAPVLICVLKGPTFVYEMANQEYMRLVGDRNIIGKMLLEVIPDFDESIYRTLQSVYATGKGHTGRDILLTADWSGTGSPEARFFTFLFEPNLDASGRAESIVVLAVDVTEGKIMEAKLQTAERLASLGTLVAGIGHEINNPLAYAMLNLEMVQNNLQKSGQIPDSLNSIYEKLRKVNKGLQRVQSIVKDLKVFSRIDDLPDKAPVRLSQVLDSALEIASNEIRSRARVVKDYSDVPLINGNEGRLGQVFLNLLINAAHAIPKGKNSNNTIWIHTSYDGNHVRVVIADSGVGISNENLSKIFDPFYTTKPVGMGTGLGLAICHNVVTSMGGEIHVESQLGRGTLVTVKLVPATETKVNDYEANAFDVKSNTGKILLIDDCEQLSEVLHEVLSREYDVTLAKNGFEALKFLNSTDMYDVVLCDLMLPDMTGMEIFEELKKKKTGMEERIIFITGGAFTSQANTFLTNVENPRLPKPFKMSELLILVGKTIQGYKNNSHYLQQREGALSFELTEPLPSAKTKS